MEEFKLALDNLSLEKQRLVSARFVAAVLDLTNDDRIIQAQKIAADPKATAESLMSAYHSVLHAAIESSLHNTFEEMDMQKQTEHFVAQACSTSLAPSHQNIKWRHMAVSVAHYCRIARICSAIQHEETKPSLAPAEESLHDQIKNQFEILQKYLDEQSA